MAKIHFEGIDVELLSMAEIANIPDDAAEEMLQAGGDVLADAQKRKYLATLKQHTGNLANSLKLSKMTRRQDGSRGITVYPRGKHHSYKHGDGFADASNTEVAFVQEYGSKKRGISAKGIIAAANAESGDAVQAAEMEIYDKWLKTKGK